MVIATRFICESSHHGLQEMGRTTVGIYHCAEEPKRWENGTDDIHGTPRTKKKELLMILIGNGTF